MAVCKYCKQAMDWGQLQNGGWVGLVPVGQEGDNPRTHQDDDGVLRTEHRLICTSFGGPTVQVTRLARKLDAEGKPL
jgi:hypothetical protein